MKRTLRDLFRLIWDAVLLHVPYVLLRNRTTYRYAFLVHPRDERDIYRKFPFMQFLPSRFLEKFEYYWTPATVARISGLQGKDGTSLEGFVISIPMTARTMLRHRDRARTQIRRAVTLARNKGAKIAGLGALTSSLTRGGLDLINIEGIAITTGHAYSGHTVTETLLSLIRDSSIPLSDLRIAIVGAAGSIGTISAEILVRAGVRHLELVDIPSKREKIEHLAERLAGRSIHIQCHSSLTILTNCHCVITATNAPEALVMSEHVKSGTIIVDDAQPSDVAQEVLERPDVLVAAAGAVFTPNIRTHFPMGLHGEEDNYCCLAEVLILAHQGHREHFVLDRPTLYTVDMVAQTGKQLGFHTATFQNERGHIPQNQLEHVLGLLQNRVKTEG